MEWFASHFDLIWDLFWFAWTDTLVYIIVAMSNTAHLEKYVSWGDSTYNRASAR